MAVGWLALELSNSAFVVGLVASVGALPIVLFSMHAGALVDRGNRLRIVRTTQTVFLAQALVLWLITLLGFVNIPLLLLLQFVQGMASAVEIPARQSMVIQLVGRDDLQPAIALNSSGFNLARVVGPALGGVIIGTFGIAWCFGVNAASFGFVLWGLARMGSVGNGEVVGNAGVGGAGVGTTGVGGTGVGTTGVGTTGVGGTGVGNTGTTEARGAGIGEVLRETSASAMEGLRYLLRRGHVRDLLALVTVGAVFGGPYLTLLPIMARDVLGLGAGGYGAMLTVVGIGGLIAALLVAGPISHRARKGPVLMGAALLFPVLVLAFAYTRWVPLAYALLFLSGLAMITWNALSNGLLQLMVEERYRGRLMAFYSLVFVGLSQAVGSFAIGALARVLDAPAAMALCATVLLGASVITLRRSSFWRVV